MDGKEADILLKKAQALAQDISVMESIDPEAAFRRGLSKVRSDRRRRFNERMVRVAACLSIPLLVSLLALGYVHFFPEQSDSFATVTAGAGSVVRYELPDKSVVWLNSGSSLTYPTVFRRHLREVSLTGEAYFDVLHDEDRPFFVSTSDGLKVKVLGTQFNVSAYEGDECIETVLESGRVNVCVDGSGEVALVPGQQASFVRSTGELIVKGANLYEKTAWKDGKIVFRNASAEDMFKQLGRKFGVEFKVRGTVGQDRYRATFRNESLPQILDYLSGAAHFSWVMEDSPDDADGSGKRVVVTFR